MRIQIAGILRKKAGERMEKLSEKKLQLLMMEVLHMERKNLRTKAKDDGKMADDIARTIIAYANQRY